MSTYKKYSIIILSIVIQSFIPVLFAQESNSGKSRENWLKIWMVHPASKWDDAFLLGNGRLGAMIFGGIEQERIQLNEESVWAGRKQEYRNPQSQEGLKEVRNLLALLRKSTLHNLFDTHPPFQIDGNFGATAGITEMLLQSHAGEIQLLPALPSAWQNGYIHGLCARGGFEVNIDWKNGELESAMIISKLGNNCQVRYGDTLISFQTEKGKHYKLNYKLEGY